MRKLCTGTLVSIALSVASSGAAQAQNLQMLVPFPAGHALNDIADLFIEKVNQRFEGRYHITIVGSDAIPGFEQFQPISAGVFPIALAAGAYHTGDTMIGLSAETLDSDPDARRESGVWAAYQEYYLTHNVRIISKPAADPGYHLMLREPIGEDGGLDGRIIRGTLTYHGPIREFGGSPTVMPVSEIYAAAERGVIDGAGHTIFGNYQLGLHEVMPYLARPGFGVSSMMILFNEDAWADIPAEDQAIFLELGHDLEHRSLQHFNELIAEETRLMEEVGAEITEFGPEQAGRVQEVFANVIWEATIEQGGETAERIRKMAQDAGLTP